MLHCEAGEHWLSPMMRGASNTPDTPGSAAIGRRNEEMNRSIMAIAALSGALLAVQPVLAASVEVQYGDLDLTSEAGRNELDKRIDRAAELACEADVKAVGSRITTREARDCIKQAKQQIEQRIAKLTGQEKAGG
jgi:UrcA family protein